MRLPSRVDPPRPPRLTALLLPLLVAAIVLVGSPHSAGAQSGASSSVLREGYDALLNLYVDPLQPADLLTTAWNGATAEAIAAGLNDLPELPQLPDNRRSAWNAFLPAYQELERRASGFTNTQNLAWAALGAMADARAECHTTFAPPESWARFLASIDGTDRSVGLGVRISTASPYTILSVIPDSPAARAGLLGGDQIITVDGQPVAEQSRTSLQTLLRGEVGSSVSLRIQRPGEAAPRAVTVIRGYYSVPVITSEIRPDGVGVVTLSTFTSDNAAERRLREALADFESRGVKGWVLDLRYNPGGSVSSLRGVLGVLEPVNTPVVTASTRVGGSLTLRTTGSPLAVQRPLAVVVGPGSASAAELAAAVLQDTGRARIVGQRTTGCANAATAVTFGDGSGMEITTARILAGPARRAVDGPGVTPDLAADTGALDAAIGAAAADVLARAAAGVR